MSQNQTAFCAADFALAYLHQVGSRYSGRALARVVPTQTCSVVTDRPLPERGAVHRGMRAISIIFIVATN
jgi:hypothetical protein